MATIQCRVQHVVQSGGTTIVHLAPLAGPTLCAFHMIEFLYQSSAQSPFQAGDVIIVDVSYTKLSDADAKAAIAAVAKPAA